MAVPVMAMGSRCRGRESRTRGGEDMERGKAEQEMIRRHGEMRCKRLRPRTRTREGRQPD